MIQTQLNDKLFFIIYLVDYKAIFILLLNKPIKISCLDNPT
jgi:hypothetical protein